MLVVEEPEAERIYQEEGKMLILLHDKNKHFVLLRTLSVLNDHQKLVYQKADLLQPDRLLRWLDEQLQSLKTVWWEYPQSAQAVQGHLPMLPRLSLINRGGDDFGLQIQNRLAGIL